MTPKIEKFTSRSLEETAQIARRFAKGLKPGQVVCFSGDLGSGKTTFIKGIAEGLGFKQKNEVKSPTFAIMHIYQSKIPVYHFDLYRLETTKEIEAIGFEEFIDDPAVISCIEWAEKAKDLLPEKVYEIRMKVAGETKRLIEIFHP